MLIDRRSFLGAAALTAACSARRTRVSTPATPSAGRQFARVNVSEDRVIRTVVGLRPYRPSGFVVRRESIEEKTIIHNYGHGGGGVTLSWGTAHLAVEQALPTGAMRMAVLGCGAVGLATARLLQEHGIEVTIYTKALPPDTTSNIAGAQVMPVTVFERARATPEFMAQFIEAARFSYRRYQLMVGDYYGIRWRPNYTLSREPIGDGSLMGRRGVLAELMPELRDLTPREHPFPFPYVRQYDTMFIYPSHYLEAMLREFRIAGGKIVLQEMHDLREVLAVPQTVILNCRSRKWITPPNPPTAYTCFPVRMAFCSGARMRWAIGTWRPIVKRRPGSWRRTRRYSTTCMSDRQLERGGLQVSRGLPRLHGLF